MSDISDISTAEAFQKLNDVIISDPDYRNAWVANIACVIYDACNRDDNTYKAMKDLGIELEPVCNTETIPNCNIIAEKIVDFIFRDDSPQS